ncbi:ATP-binding cassette domain-containing protein [Spirillospora sp. NPDC052269]
MLSNLAIHAERLQKTYSGPGGEIQAVRNIDLSVRKGEFFGLLGPNGAGKSTTIGMLTTLVRPTAGRARVCGLDVRTDPAGVKRQIGTVAQDNTLDIELTLAENLEFRGRYFGMRRRDARRRAERLAEHFGLADRRGARPFELSGGQVKRAMIARALMHRPAVLFLDEPTAGLDPQTRINLWELLRALQAEGQTVLLTTHYMEEAESLCDRLAVIDHGRVLACDTVQGLQESVGGETVITLSYRGEPFDVDELRGRDGVDRIEAADGRVRVFAREPDGVLSELVALAAKAGVTVVEAAQMLPSLETVFLTLTGREYRE